MGMQRNGRPPGKVPVPLGTQWVRRLIENRFSEIGFHDVLVSIRFHSVS